MDRQTEINLIQEIIGLAEQKSTFLDETIAHSPISRYSSPERFEREQAMIFRRKPVVAAHSSELVGKNSFIARDFLGLPLLLTRNEAGDVNAFLNVCRHRGAKVERSVTGCKRVFTCPYHGWSWTNQGDLRGVTRETQGFPDLPRAERGLRRLPCTEAHGFIWIIANPDAADIPNIDQWLGGLADDFNWLELDKHKIMALETKTIKANWKVLFEGGLEAYHFRIAHKDTIAPYFPDNLLTYRQFETHMRAVLPRISMPELHKTPQENWAIRQNANLLYTLVRNVQMLVQQDHVMLFHYEPLSFNETRVRMATLAHRDEPQTAEKKAYWEKNQRITVTALMEDFVLGEEVQAGFASKGNPSHLFGRFEGALNRFNLIVEELIAT